MLPRWHLLFGFIFSYTLVYFFNFSLFAGLVIFLSSIFIDLDHVLLYYLENKNLNPKNFFNWSDKKNLLWKSLEQEEKKKFKSPQYLLHGVEFILLLSVLSIKYVLFFWILLGILLHLLLDFFDLFYKREHHHFSLKFSQIWVWHRNKGKKSFALVNVF